MLVLEDLHWADRTPWHWSSTLVTTSGAERVLCLATCRSEPASAAMAMIRRMHDRRSVVLLEPRPLDARQVAAMVRACRPGAAEEIVARVQRTADDVPFLVEEPAMTMPGTAAWPSARCGRMVRLGRDPFRWRPWGGLGQGRQLGLRSARVRSGAARTGVLALAEIPVAVAAEV